VRRCKPSGSKRASSCDKCVYHRAGSKVVALTWLPPCESISRPERLELAKGDTERNATLYTPDTQYEKGLA